MKGYNFLNLEKSKRIIKEYKLEGQKLTLHMNDGETLVYDFPEEIFDKEKVITQVTELQQEAFDTYNDKGIKKLKSKQISNRILLITFLILGGITGFAWTPLASSIIALGAFATIEALILSYFFVKDIKIVKDLNELEKQKYLMDNIEEFTDEIIENRNICQCISDKKIYKLNDGRVKTGTVFNLTTVDDVKLEDLKNLRANILREKYLGFAYDIKELEEQKVKTLGTLE